MVTWVCVVLHPSSIHAEGYGILRGLGKRHHAFGLRNRLKKKLKKWLLISFFLAIRGYILIILFFNRFVIFNL